MEITKADCINEFMRLADELGGTKLVSRDVFREMAGIATTRVEALFGSFGALKQEIREQEANGIEIRYEKKKYVKPGRGEWKRPNSGRKKKKAKLSEEEIESLHLNTVNYHFNDSTNQYIIFSKTVNKNIVLDAHVLESLLEAYSNFDGSPSSINEICRSHGISRKIFTDIKSAMGWTHDSLPFTNENVLATEDEELVDDLVQRRLFGVDQKFKKKTWARIEQDAENYQLWERGLLNPMKEFMDLWEPPEELTYYYESPKYRMKGKPVSMVIGFNDIHFGRQGQARKLYHHKDWNIDSTAKAVGVYGEKLATHIQERQPNMQECVLLSLGDILDSITGLTDKGTPLDAFPIREEQFEYATNSLVSFVLAVRHALPAGVPLKIKATSGNHDSFADWALFQYLSAWFREYDDIEFDISEKRWLSFETLGNMITIEHGYSPFYKGAKLPRAGKERENYIKDVMLRHPDMYAACENRYYIVGDQHHVENQEYMHFELLMFPALAGGSQHEDHNNLKSRQRQKALIYDEDGLKEELHFYFDDITT
jgi:hypothetical protein